MPHKGTNLTFYVFQTMRPTVSLCRTTVFLLYQHLESQVKNQLRIPVFHAFRKQYLNTTAPLRPPTPDPVGATAPDLSRTSPEYLSDFLLACQRHYAGGTTAVQGGHYNGGTLPHGLSPCDHVQKFFSGNFGGRCLVPSAPRIA